MKRFLAFAGNDYYPYEAFGRDFINDYDSLDDAKMACLQKANECYMWAIIIDQENRKQIVADIERNEGKFRSWNESREIGESE